VTIPMQPIEGPFAVETGAAEEVLGAPRHPYTKRLIAAVPSLDFAAAPPVEAGP